MEDPGSEHDIKEDQVTLVCSECGMDCDVHEDVADEWTTCVPCRVIRADD